MSQNSGIIDVTDADFDERVLKAQGVVVVDFWAAWCPPCQMIKPYLPKLALDYDGRLQMAAYDRDLGREVFDRLGLQGIPNIVAFKDGEMIGAVVGGREYPELKAAFAEMLEGHVEPRPLHPEMEEFFCETVAAMVANREEDLKPAQEKFRAKSEPVYARIKPPYVEAHRQHQAGEIDDAAMQAARATFEQAFEAELGADYAEFEAASKAANDEAHEAIAYIIETFAEMADEIYVLPEPDSDGTVAAG